MRITLLIALAGVALCLSGVFAPAGQLDPGGPLSRLTRTRSLYQLGKSTDAARQFLASYHASAAKRVGERVLDKVAPKLPGRVAGHAADVQDALSTLDQLHDDDVKTVGTIVAVTMWSLVGACVILLVLVYGLGVTSTRARVAGAVIVAVVVAAIAVGVYLVLARVAVEANAELGRPMISLRGGAYLMPIGALVALVGTVASAVAYARHRAGLRAAAAAPLVR
ncbi:MAG: hypothetical protein R3B06_23220 [Kofleriaceae bacterium]